MTRRAAALALAAALLTPAVPAAAGDSTHLRFLRGCEFDTVAQETVTGGRYTGAMWANVLAYSVSPEHNPVTITSIGCELRINGVAVAGTPSWPGAGPVGVVPPQPVDFALADTDFVDLCTLVDVVDGQGEAHRLTRCPGATTLPMPPPWMTNLVDDVFTLLYAATPADEALTAADEAACAQLRAAAPYLPPPVTVGPDGDVYVSGELWWDCPPYV